MTPKFNYTVHAVPHKMDLSYDNDYHGRETDKVDAWRTEDTLEEFISEKCNGGAELIGQSELAGEYTLLTFRRLV